MRENHGITESEKELLHAVGRNPDISMKELLEYTTYKWTRTVIRKLSRLKKQHILIGPHNYINYGRLSKNSLHKVLCVIESNQSYNTVISYLRLIEPLLWVYPVLSPHKNMLHALFFSSNDVAMINILEILKENGIITDYILRVLCHKGVIENPNLFGDSNPSLDNLLEPCDLPEITVGHHDTEWNECDIAILPYLERGTKLIEILRKERNLNFKRFTYEQIKYSREKMIKNGLIEKLYVVNPFPIDQCANFRLFLRTDDTTLTQRILCNFAKGARILKQHTLYEEWGSASIWGCVSCTCHPMFLTNLMHKLDRVKQIQKREVYQIRSFPHKKYYLGLPPNFKHFDFETQTLEYPYPAYEERIKERIEGVKIRVHDAVQSIPPV
jgi:DNA-binding Lrp family transcriptional regulator